MPIPLRIQYRGALALRLGRDSLAIPAAIERWFGEMVAVAADRHLHYSGPHLVLEIELGDSVDAKQHPLLNNVIRLQLVTLQPGSGTEEILWEEVYRGTRLRAGVGGVTALALDILDQFFVEYMGRDPPH